MTKDGNDHTTPETPRPTLPGAPILTPETVLKRAVDTARDRARDLWDGLQALDVLGDAEQVTIKGDTLKYLTSRFMADANAIMTDLDHAQHALEGGTYNDADNRFRCRGDALSAMAQEGQP